MSVEIGTALRVTSLATREDLCDRCRACKALETRLHKFGRVPECCSPSTRSPYTAIAVNNIIFRRTIGKQTIAPGRGSLCC